MNILQTISALSHEFGTSDYVLGGGGNTSCKDEHILWVKPSGTTLQTLQPDLFVAMDRKKLSRLYDIDPPETPSEREKLVKEMMGQAVLSESQGRASVEAPLHDSLNARYVVHTHPAMVNGLTCSKNGKESANTLFPDALWLDYIDPGYTLCMQVRKEIQAYVAQNGSEPQIILLKNHGVFVAADEPDEIRCLYAEIMTKLEAEYKQTGVALELKVGPEPAESKVRTAESTIRDAMQNSDLSIAASGFFDVASGPISPDHIVYSKSYPFIGCPTSESLQAFQGKHGYLPQVISFDNAVYGVAETEKKAMLALELAQDGALVVQLARAFGGIDYMTEQAREFIENWEVESYRQQQMQNQ